MSRSSWKVPYIAFSLLSENFDFRDVYIFFKRNYLITPLCVDKIFKIYNGRDFLNFKIKSGHINLRLGQLSKTTVSGNVKKKNSNSF